MHRIGTGAFKLLQDEFVEVMRTVLEDVRKKKLPVNGQRTARFCHKDGADAANLDDRKLKFSGSARTRESRKLVDKDGLVLVPYTRLVYMPAFATTCFATVKKLELAMHVLVRTWRSGRDAEVQTHTHLMFLEDGAGKNGKRDDSEESVYIVFSMLKIEGL